jgi:ribonuclease H2 subunit A
VGPPETYQAKLEKLFPSLHIIVSKKADALYPTVSAASIAAKVTRDTILAEWVFPEQRNKHILNIHEDGWGSGYPGGM